MSSSSTSHRDKKRVAKPCVVCTNAGSYKCPQCYACYCSVACCKQHKEECSTLLGKGAATASTTAKEGCDKGTGEVSTAGSCGIAKEDPLEKVILLSKEQQERLEGCAWLREALKSKRLRQHISEVDGAGSGVGATRRAHLAALRRSSSDFDQFAQRLIAEIAVVEPGEALSARSCNINSSSTGDEVLAEEEGADEESDVEQGEEQ